VTVGAVDGTALVGSTVDLPGTVWLQVLDWMDALIGLEMA